MSARDDAQAAVDQLEALHNALLDAWQRASNAQQYDLAKGLNDQADRAGDQLLLARQNLLDAIDGGQDVTDLLTRIEGLAATIKAEQAKVEAGTQTMAEVSGVLDAVGQAIAKS